ISKPSCRCRISGSETLRAWFTRHIAFSAATSRAPRRSALRDGKRGLGASGAAGAEPGNLDHVRRTPFPETGLTLENVVAEAAFEYEASRHPVFDTVGREWWPAPDVVFERDQEQRSTGIAQREQPVDVTLTLL